jgi:hypothetical protein
MTKIKVMLKPYDITTEKGKFPIGMAAIDYSLKNNK